MPICGRPWKEDTLREFFESSAYSYILHFHNVLFPHGIAEGARGLAAGEDPRGFFPCGLSIYLSIYIYIYIEEAQIWSRESRPIGSPGARGVPFLIVAALL